MDCSCSARQRLTSPSEFQGFFEAWNAVVAAAPLLKCDDDATLEATDVEGVCVGVSVVRGVWK